MGQRRGGAVGVDARGVSDVGGVAGVADVVVAVAGIGALAVGGRSIGVEGGNGVYDAGVGEGGDDDGSGGVVEAVAVGGGVECVGIFVVETRGRRGVISVRDAGSSMVEAVGVCKTSKGTRVMCCVDTS